jgi:predicted O-methyltransferase YrrM
MSMASIFRKTIWTVRNEGPTAAVIKAARRGRFVLDVATATWALRSEVRRTRNLGEELDFAFGFSVGAVTIAPFQVRSEIAALLELLGAEPPRNVLEIGTHRGGTLFLLSRVARADANLASIDLPGGAFGGGYDRIWVLLLKVLPRERQTLKLMRADSHASRTLNEAQRWLAGKPLDCLLIDGDHRFEGVRRDFLMYGPLVRAGGVIAIHDIVPGPEDKVGGVPTFWNVVKDAYETRELVKDWRQGGFGIGVVWVPPEGIKSDGPILDVGGPEDSREAELFE